MIRSILGRAVRPQPNALSRFNSIRMTSGQFSQRSYTTKCSGANAEVKDNQEIQPETFMDVARKYGLAPLAILGGAALFSKEFYVITPDTLLLGNTMIIYFGAYVLGSESFTDWVQKGVAAKNKQLTDIVDLEKYMILNRMNLLKSRMHFPAFLEKLKAAEVSSMEAFYEAKTREMHLKAAETVEAELRGAKDRIQRDEELAEARENEALARFVGDYLEDYVSKDEHLNYLDAMIDNFDNLTGPQFHLVKTQLNPLQQALAQYDAEDVPAQA